jgi:drug/metabolite transporter (DMT)-like permease
MDAASQKTNIPKAAAFILGSGALFALMAATVKGASRELPDAMIVFFRNSMGLLALVPWLALGRSRGLTTRDPLGHVVRGLAGVAAMYCYFYAVARTRLADAVLLNQCSPLFIPLVERVWLGEKIPPRLWLVLSIGFAGLVVILRPGTTLFTPVSLVGLASGVLAALAQVGIRRLTRTEPVTRIVLYFAVVGSVVSAPPAAIAWRNPSPALWGALVLLGVFATAGQLCLTKGYSFGPAGLVGPFVFAGPLFAGLIDWVLWNQPPDATFLAGATLVILSGTLALRLREEAAPEIET